MSEFWEQVESWFGAAFSPVLASETVLGAPTRIHGIYLLSALMLAVVLYWAWRRTEGPGGIRGFFAFAFPKAVYTHRSAWVDVQLWLVNKIFSAGIVVALAGLTAATALAVAGWLEAGGTSGAAPLDGWARLALFTVLLVAVSDFTVYWVHRLFHEVPLLWPFHRVHHSAEVLTPLTLYRKHPVYDLASFALRGGLVGLTQGLLVWLWPGTIDYWTLLGENLVYAAFNLAGSNLRHTHIWLGFGRFWSHIFISPAQHQIHHSRAPEHWDKNYGEVFAIWDWMFGSLYVPKGRETLAFGVAGEEGTATPQLHPTLLRAYVEPFEASWTVLRGERKPPGRAIDQEPSAQEVPS